jgi:hypothetical protein
MDQKVTAVRAEQWRQTIYDCINRDTDITKRQWCQENGIRYRSLMYWQHKFRMEALGLTADHEAALPAKQDTASVPAFADMTPHLEALQAEREAAPAEPETAFTPELMIQAGSHRIYVGDSIQETTLETVMRVIRHA